MLACTDGHRQANVALHRVQTLTGKTEVVLYAWYIIMVTGNHMLYWTGYRWQALWYTPSVQFSTVPIHLVCLQVRCQVCWEWLHLMIIRSSYLSTQAPESGDWTSGQPTAVDEIQTDTIIIFEQILQPRVRRSDNKDQNWIRIVTTVDSIVDSQTTI